MGKLWKRHYVGKSWKKDLWKVVEKTSSCGKVLEKTWESRGKDIRWESPGKDMGKLWIRHHHVGKSWKGHGKVVDKTSSCGKILERTWESCGKDIFMWESPGKDTGKLLKRHWKALEKMWGKSW